MTSAASANDGATGTALDYGEVARGSRVVIRAKRLGDTPDDYRWRSDPELSRYDAARPIAVTYQEYFAVMREEVLYPSPYRRSLAIEDVGGAHIGNIMYYNIDSLRQEAELGITIGERAYWSGGYGSEAVALLARHLLTSGAFRRLHLKTLDWNRRARRAFEKAGFVECGKAQRAGNVFVLMELRAEWLPGPPN
jgi:RimJ/RimL family protein N-acetyltransferase